MEFFENNFTFTGKEYDEATGLYYFGARYYDPKVGRFITKDPILEPVVLQTLPVPFEDILEDTIDSSSPDFIVPEMIDIPQDLHPYMYCYNNPINWIDPFGLCPEESGLESTWDELMLIPGLGLVGKAGKGAKTAQEIISLAKKGSILREFPSEMLGKTLAEIEALAKKGNWKARKTLKLLKQKKYSKSKK
ncbi:MAG: RHS repeat-associated core domain-containing protein [bacterium]